MRANKNNDYASEINQSSKSLLENKTGNSSDEQKQSTSANSYPSMDSKANMSNWVAPLAFFSGSYINDNINPFKENMDQVDCYKMFQAYSQKLSEEYTYQLFSSMSTMQNYCFWDTFRKDNEQMFR